MEVTNPQELVARLSNDIGRAWARCLELPQPVEILVPDQPIQSALLVFKVVVPDGISWDDMTAAFHDVKTSTNVVFGFWVDSDNDLWIRAGVDVFSGIRLDRGLLSRAYSVLNDLAYESPRRLQLIKLTAKERPQQTNMPARVLGERQEIAYFLRYSLRLNPQDIASVLQLLDRMHWKWEDSHKMSQGTCKSRCISD